MAFAVTLNVNGQRHTISTDPRRALLDVLREDLGLTGTNYGCGEGECGACTVLLDGRPVLSCLVPLVQCAEREIRTVEGLASADASFLEQFVATGGVQCGACTPGIVVTAAALLAEKPAPTRDEVQRALAGNLCRCTGYEGIIRALVGEEER